ncbi:MULTISPECIES: flagellar protein FlaG [Ferrimonas]|uniref:flagellar protein FlaG n=1 Tax=Ferrimonas TaxID=44011 RepID=UPI0003FFCC55|nr:MULTISPECIES: flagellar protein FlaG [Ferrimonas]USD38618.1 flagellar protein FlaG [Ferrimonas sp. SCSIO 43195]
MDSTLINSVGTPVAVSAVKPELSAEQQLQKAGQAEAVAADAVTATAKAEEANESKQNQDDRIAQATHGMNEFFDSMNKEIRFHIDEKTDRSVVKVVEAKTGEVIRQIPAEEVLELAARMSEASGLLMKEEI